MMTRTQKAKETDSHERDDIDPFNAGGANDGNPEDKDEEASGELDAEFNQILLLYFKSRTGPNTKYLKLCNMRGSTHGDYSLKLTLHSYQALQR